MWKSVSPLYRDRGCILRSGARRRRHVTSSFFVERRATCIAVSSPVLLVALAAPSHMLELGGLCRPGRSDR